MGAAKPPAAGQAVLQVACELGLPRLRVVVITGGDVLPWMRAHDVPLIDYDLNVRNFDNTLGSANACLGDDALLPAPVAAVIITGRVANPALFLAPLMHHFSWQPDDWLRMAQGIAVGHLLEGAAQVSCGHLADPGYVEVPGLHEIGFPLAEVQADGGAVITRLLGTGGGIDRLSCTAPLRYERDDLARFLQPDVVADFSDVRLQEAGPDRVQPIGANGQPQPEQSSVTFGCRGGFIGEGQISSVGFGARARGHVTRSRWRFVLEDHLP